MTILNDFVRVSRARRCPICDRPDWCLVSRDEPPSRVICSRVADGSKRSCGEAGYLHVLRADDWRPSPHRTVRVPMNCPAIPSSSMADAAARYYAAAPVAAVERFAADLGVSIAALSLLEVGWSPDHNAWSFPMKDATGNVRGIRLRLPSGRKLAVKGGREGLFIPLTMPTGPRLLVCEGPTDTAALLDLGFAAVGRPSCTGGVRLLVDLVRDRRPAEVVVVSDADEPGRRGAANLAAVLVAYAPSVRIIEPPAGVKDARDWKRRGVTTAEVAAAIDVAEVRKLRITTTIIDRKAGCRHG